MKDSTVCALQDTSGATADGVCLPLAIMTSDDTHARTEELLKQHKYFGMQPDQVRAVFVRPATLALIPYTHTSRVSNLGVILK